MTGSRFGVLCLILLLAVLGLGFKNYEIWSRPAGAGIKREIPKKPEARTEKVLPGPAVAEILPPEAYKAVAEKNLFHPDRQEFPVSAAPDQTRPAARPQIQLYGILIGGDHQAATVVNPGRTLAKGERETKTVKVGDRIGEYSVAKIQEDRIVMESAGDSFEVLLYDPNAPKKRVEVRTPAPQVAVTSSAAGPSPPPPPGTPAPPVAAIPPRTPPIPPAQPSPPLPHPAPQVAVPRPAEPTPGAVLQPQAPSSPAAPGIGVWRGRRPFRPAEPETPGN